MQESKFAGLTAKIKEAQEQPQPAERSESTQVVQNTASKGRAPGKRSDPAWKQHTVMLKRETHLEATDILRRQENGGDVSELLEGLLEKWVRNHRKP